MEGKNNSSPSLPLTGDDKLGRKAVNSSARYSSSSPGYFSSVIPPASTVIAKDLSHSDLCWTLNKQRNDGRIVSAQSTAAGCKSSQGSPKRQTTQNKDTKSTYPGEYIESPYFGSSVNYGARDFYTSSSSSQTSKTPENYRVDEGADLGDIHVADRGEWWQGSLYY